MNLKDAGIDAGLAIAGLFGALLTTSARNEKQSIWQSAVSIIGGAASANYLTPLVLKWINVANETQFQYATAFLIGVSGLRVVERIVSRYVDAQHLPQRRR
jgi:zinc transporter ZupT